MDGPSDIDGDGVHHLLGQHLSYKKFQYAGHIGMKEESLRHRRVGEVNVKVIKADIHKNFIGKQG